ncbi:MAG: holo-ACP synthase [Chloroflexota bacterium]
MTDVPSIGVDIIEIRRVEHALSRWGGRFLRRVYTDAEINTYQGRVPSLASRFAAKEAIMKVLGTGARGIRWRDIEILNDTLGKPTVRLYDRAAYRAQELRLMHFAVSLSDSKEYAVAMAMGA